VGLDREKRTLLLFVIDGRQPNYSEGVTLPELAQIAIEYGSNEAFNLDGGGSSTLVTEDQSGKPQVLNSPVHGSVPGLERPVGNQPECG
jgi:exopolysaccharide biosynthesis protein